jgi:hypothetical protein
MIKHNTTIQKNDLWKMSYYRQGKIMLERIIIATERTNNHTKFLNVKEIIYNGYKIQKMDTVLYNNKTISEVDEYFFEYMGNENNYPEYFI